MEKNLRQKGGHVDFQILPGFQSICHQFSERSLNPNINTHSISEESVAGKTHVPASMQWWVYGSGAGRNSRGKPSRNKVELDSQLKVGTQRDWLTHLRGVPDRGQAAISAKRFEYTSDHGPAWAIVTDGRAINGKA